MNLRSTSIYGGHREAGLDEVGRGCLAGPVVAAAVIWPENIQIASLKDSKLLSLKERTNLECVIKEHAIAWSIGLATVEEIDLHNIANATFIAMHRAIASLPISPDGLVIDGNRFKPYPEIPHICLVKADNSITSVAAASVLAKTHRDRLMEALHGSFPHYSWDENKGYPTPKHKRALLEHGVSIHHRKTFYPVKQALAHHQGLQR